MCELDFDEYASVWDERLIGRARRAHCCDTCSAAIAPGESYVAHFSVCSGDATHEKQCLRCRTHSGTTSDFPRRLKRCTSWRTSSTRKWDAVRSRTENA